MALEVQSTARGTMIVPSTPGHSWYWSHILKFQYWTIAQGGVAPGSPEYSSEGPTKQKQKNKLKERIFFQNKNKIKQNYLLKHLVEKQDLSQDVFRTRQQAMF